MNKSILKEYADACALVRETELELERLEGRRPTIVKDKVTGSMRVFPYIGKNFTVEGAIDPGRNETEIKNKKLELENRKKSAEAVKSKVDQWMDAAPLRIQRIARMRYLEKMTWDEISIKVGTKATADSVRMELERFLKKN